MSTVSPLEVRSSSCNSSLSALPQPDGRLHSSRVKIKQGIVKSVQRLNYDTMEVVVKCDDGGSPPLGSAAGQYATLRTPEIKSPRSFSFVRAPENEAENEHTFMVRLLPGGQFSGWLFEKDRTGSPITISGPLGRFGLDTSNQTMVCIAGGSGMSAIKAILEHAANIKSARDCLFLYGGRQQRDLYYHKEIEVIKQNWSSKHKFEFVQVLSDEPEDSDWKGARGFVTDYFKKNYLDTGKLDVNSFKAYFCGPPPMIDAGVALLKEAGVAKQSIYYDKFEDMSSPAPVIDNTKCVLCDECLLVKPVESCIVEVSKLIRGDNGSFTGYELVDPAYTSGLYYNTLYIDEQECIRCFACVDACPADAISPAYEKLPKMLRQIITE